MLFNNGARRRVVLVQIGENSATLTPFGSLIRVNPAMMMLGKGHLSGGKSWRARLRAILLCSFADFRGYIGRWRLLDRRFPPTRKYLRMNGPSRPCRGAPQLTHVISRSVVGPGGASTRTTSYFAAQFGHSNDRELDIGQRLRTRSRSAR